MAKAISSVYQMDIRQKEQVCDELYAEQPNMLASVLVHSRMGSPMDRIDRVLHVLLVAVQATKIAGIPYEAHYRRRPGPRTTALRRTHKVS